MQYGYDRNYITIDFGRTQVQHTMKYMVWNGRDQSIKRRKGVNLIPYESDVVLSSGKIQLGDQAL